MSDTSPLDSPELGFLSRLAATTTRRTFLQWAGVTVAVTAIGCSDDDGTGPNPPDDDAVDLGSGDVGILNYAYALEQLEAAFYTQVMDTPFGGMTVDETQILTDIRDHEITHREFFKAALAGNAIDPLSVDFSSVTFSSRASVLGTAKVFEDLGVSAYNGAGKLLSADNYLVAAGKIVSVEARHAAAIRDLLNPNSIDFAGDDVVDANGLDQQKAPAMVLAAADPFVTSTIDASHLPTT